jgi:serine/threonine-protein kinase
VPEPVRNLIMACIAKNPSDRPSSAAHLARAAQSLRRGDIAAAAAAVPAILGGESLTAATRVMPQGTAANTRATTVLPQQAAAVVPAPPAATPDAAKQTKKRSPWTVPLIILIVLLVGALVWSLINFLSPGSNSDAVNTPSATKTSASARPTPSATPTQDRGTIDPNDYIGKTYNEAVQMLNAGGWHNLKEDTSKPATDAQAVGTVWTVDPSQLVPYTTQVTVFVYGDLVQPSAPAAAPTVQSQSQDPAVPGTQFTFKFGNDSCPSGQTLTAHRLYINGTAQSWVDGSTPTANWTVPSEAENSTVTVTYTVQCAGTNESGQSPALPVKISSNNSPTPTSPASSSPTPSTNQ